jgi:oligopeptide/dipeptide ABC transporter ATP-binding protein
VLYLGKVMEVAETDALFEQPLHPYTRALLDSVPGVGARTRKTIPGEPPSPVHPPSGCRFRTRCPKAQDKCAAEEPQIRQMAPGQFVACHFPLAPGETLATRNGQMPSTA